MKIRFISPLFLVILGCATGKKDIPADPLVVNRDTTVRPGTDFFHYANGGWFNRNAIPESESINGLWRIIGDTINVQVRHICERSAANTSEKGSMKQKIGDFYASGMDTVAIEKAGMDPLRGELQKIAAIHDIPALNLGIQRLHEIGAGPAYSLYVTQDSKISSKYAITLWQGGLGLDERDYYMNTDTSNANIRKKYVRHIGAMMRLTGEDSVKAQKSATVVMAIETDLAKSSRKLEALRDPIKNYNKMTVAELNKLTPGIAWKDVLAARGFGAPDTVVVGQPEFYSALNAALHKFPIDEWKTYLKWHLVTGFAQYLSRDFDEENFRFFGTVLNGRTKQRARWKRVVRETDGQLGDLIGQVYVKEYLPAGSKEKLLEIGNAIRTVYADHIRKLSWMSEATKEKALLKLEKIVMKIGYPDKWKDLSDLHVDRASYCGNVMHANEWHTHHNVQRFGKPVDRTEWGMQPHTFNAYYNPSNNEICLPACNVIVPGYEGRLPDDAILYGMVGGSTVGHELTHGFDDEGSQFDENGNLKNWWSKEDREKFVSKTRLIVTQFADYVAVDSLHVNGEATQGENIADLGGVVMGFEAFSKTPQFKENKEINGFTPAQRYFLGYAYSWMINRKKESLKQQIMTDVHAPEMYRVNGPLSNVPEFYQAFGVEPGDAMYRGDSVRVVIW